MTYKHIKPPFWSYYGEFTHVNRCTNEDCGALGMYHTLSLREPCPFCGGEIVRCNVAAKWIPPVYKYKWLKLNKVSDGYWKFSVVKK